MADDYGNLTARRLWGELMRILNTALLLLLFASTAHAGRVVMFFGDSMTNTGGANSYPKIVDAARADFTVCVNYQNGRTTEQGIAAIDAAMAVCALLGDLTDVVSLLGINDLLFIGGTATESAERTREIMAHVVATGRRGWIMESPPGPITTWGFLDGRVWTRDVNAAHHYLNGIGPAEYPILRARDRFVLTQWYVSTCSNDELHPTGTLCKQALAAEPIAVLP